jgi:hypothetical protein
VTNDDQPAPASAAAPLALSARIARTAHESAHRAVSGFADDMAEAARRALVSLTDDAAELFRDVATGVIDAVAESLRRAVMDFVGVPGTVTSDGAEAEA